jgi:hypothetical protein
MKNNESFYQTRDLFEASLLKTLEIEYLGAEVKNKDVWFSFNQKDVCEKIIDHHINGELEINSREFINSQRDIKGIIIKLTKRN